MIFHFRQRLFAQGTGQATVNLVVAGRGVVAGQVHGGPVLLASLGAEAQPGEVLGLGGQLAHALANLV